MIRIDEYGMSVTKVCTYERERFPGNWQPFYLRPQRGGGSAAPDSPAFDHRDAFEQFFPAAEDHRDGDTYSDVHADIWEGWRARGEYLTETQRSSSGARSDETKTGRGAVVEPPEPAEGWKLLKDTTQAERSFPEDASHENGNYFHNCVHCLRVFIGHKRRGICKVCEARPVAPSSLPPEPLPIPECVCGRCTAFIYCNPTARSGKSAEPVGKRPCACCGGSGWED